MPVSLSFSQRALRSLRTLKILCRLFKQSRPKGQRWHGNTQMAHNNSRNNPNYIAATPKERWTSRFPNLNHVFVHHHGQVAFRSDLSPSSHTAAPFLDFCRLCLYEVLQNSVVLWELDSVLYGVPLYCTALHYAVEYVLRKYSDDLKMLHRSVVLGE